MGVHIRFHSLGIASTNTGGFPMGLRSHAFFRIMAGQACLTHWKILASEFSTLNLNILLCRGGSSLASLDVRPTPRNSGVASGI